ncbi:MAG: hypothetical protein CO108_08835 [Deltaproteobacteria bacterium CG_4_9_14_3_um_filter_63_12]|nr:MAG: hypothetical protein CO108_08835 [Deltaproteobacteria bacterium CG_4_9_14_3_um_filter_63_12]
MEDVVELVGHAFGEQPHFVVWSEGNGPLQFDEKVTVLGLSFNDGELPAYALEEHFEWLWRRSTSKRSRPVVEVDAGLQLELIEPTTNRQSAVHHGQCNATCPNHAQLGVEQH